MLSITIRFATQNAEIGMANKIGIVVVSEIAEGINRFNLKGRSLRIAGQGESF